MYTAQFHGELDIIKADSSLELHKSHFRFVDSKLRVRSIRKSLRIYRCVSEEYLEF